MYDELEATLRRQCVEMDCGNCNTCVKRQAADAIEELSKPRWIPVSERLPEAESGYTSKPVLVTDGDCMAIAEWFNFELCEPYWSYTGIGDITHWMPLPEPPKEE